MACSFDDHWLFVSHSSKDKDVVDNIVEALKSKSVKVWYDKDQIGLGAQWDEKIAKDLQNMYGFVCCLSDDFYKSDICFRELKAFRERQRRNPNIPSESVFPIVIGESDKDAEHVIRWNLMLPPTTHYKRWPRDKDAILQTLEMYASGTPVDPPRQPAAPVNPPPQPPLPQPQPSPTQTGDPPVVGPQSNESTDSATDAPFNKEVFMDNYMDRFLKAVPAKYVVVNWAVRKIISQDTRAEVERALPGAQCGILFEGIKTHGSLATIRKMCDLMIETGKGGYPNMRALGEEMKENLKQYR